MKYYEIFYDDRIPDRGGCTGWTQRFKGPDAKEKMDAFVASISKDLNWKGELRYKEIRVYEIESTVIRDEPR